MKPIVGPLLPPKTPPMLPHGLDRGGIFEADYIPSQYIDARRRTIPTDSPMAKNVTTDVFMQRIAFRKPNEVLPITQRPMQGYGQAPGYSRYYTSHDWQHRHYLDLPQETHMASGHRHGYGRMVQGMIPQAGTRMISADRPPQPIHPRMPVQTPHGDTEGGIFGPGAVIGGMATGGPIPGVQTKDIMTVRQITGFGAGPDGIG